MSTNHVSDNGRRIPRREAMRRGLSGAAGLLLADRLGSGALSVAAEAEKAPPGVTTMAQRRRLDQQLLTLQIAVQMKEQAETHAEFDKALTGVSKTIADMFGSADLVRTQKDFELAMAKAQSMEQRVDLFLSSASGGMFGEPVGQEEVVSDAEIDRLVEAEAAAAERSADAEVDKGLKAIREELAKEQ